MDTTLANVGHVVRSLLSPRQWTVITLKDAAANKSEAHETDTGVDVTLGRKESPATASGTAKTPAKPGKRNPTEVPKVESLTSADLVISPAFKLVVILVFTVILLSGAAMVLMAIFGDPKNTTLQPVSSVMSTAFTASVGAILGLIGGKVAV